MADLGPMRSTIMAGVAASPSRTTWPSPRWDGIRYVSRQINKGFAYAIFERSGLRKLRAEKLKARHVDYLCDRFNVTAV